MLSIRQRGEALALPRVRAAQARNLKLFYAARTYGAWLFVALYLLVAGLRSPHPRKLRQLHPKWSCAKRTPNGEAVDNPITALA